MKKISLKYDTTVIVNLLIIICIVVLGLIYISENLYKYTNVIRHTNGIYIPKIKLPKGSTASMDMIGLIVYDGRIYTQTSTDIEPSDAESFLGEKLGITKGDIDEWSKQESYSVEFISNISARNVYTVKGYDKKFRIMMYNKIDGTIYSEFYECLNGITIKTGDDIFGKLKIENNIKSAMYEDYNSWNNGEKKYKELLKLDKVYSFVGKLKDTIPYSTESLSYLWDEKNKTNKKLLYLTLKDSSRVRLVLYKDGYIGYGMSHVFFKMESEDFNDLWNELT